MKYTDFSDWASDVMDFLNTSVSDIQVDEFGYSVRKSDDVVAYFDRFISVGFIEV
jgi:hypothetical protein